MHRVFTLIFAWAAFVGFLAGTAVVTDAQSTYVEAVLADGPVAYWHLDETDFTDPIVEATGNVANGEWDGRGDAPQLRVPGIPGAPGTAARLQFGQVGFGCAANCSRGSVPVGGALDLGTVERETDITLETWFKLLPSVDEALPPSMYPRIFGLDRNLANSTASWPSLASC